MDVTDCGLLVSSHSKLKNTQHHNTSIMGLPSPYIQPQMKQNFATQVCAQARVEHGKPLLSSTSSNYKSRSRSPINCLTAHVKDVSTGSVTSNEEHSDFDDPFSSRDLPEELTSLFSARHCDLCVVQMNSELQSKMHYHGKQHKKKVRFFMNKWKKEPRVSYPEGSGNDNGPDHLKNPDDMRLYCECCDLSFTSDLHAQQHYRGRNHQRVLNGLEPLKSGYFNKLTCKWQRFPPTEVVNGVAVSPCESMSSHDSPSTNQDVNYSGISSERGEDQKSRRGRFFCELCNIGATSQEQLDMHIKGGKHKKAERVIQQFDSTVEDSEVIKALPADSILASVTKDSVNPKKAKMKDYSIYRTPSGKFYCQLCNLTVQCESQFIQHLDSKKHRITTGPKRYSSAGFNR
ncbi:zinc finger matrin-type protein 3-like [Ischnura elegans]|uniref:zinc finger matrin-type protein 3-like n=1 Tax=Ischnura elegans TaxID=197161 RepID=UPI001ED8AFAB|nr:zinc finger matrin-type protein 3-like [Ischnura elegans]